MSSPPTTVPLPPSGEYIRAVRDSARETVASGAVKLAPNAIANFWSTTPRETFERLSTAHGVTLPLRFSSPLEELNLVAVLALLNFGSGYRVPLHEATGRGAFDTVRAFVLSLHLSDEDLLSARGMRDVSEAQVAELARLPTHVESQHPTMPFVTVGQRGGPLAELVTLITTVLNETGKILVEGGWENLGAFVRDALVEADKAGKEKGEGGPSADMVLEKLVSIFPAFRDCYRVPSVPLPIYLFKKALFLLHAVELRFGSQPSPPFPLPSPKTCPLPAFSDNVIPSMLIHLSLLLPPPNLAASFSPRPPIEGPHLTASEAAILRAGAVHAIQELVAYANGPEGRGQWFEGVSDVQVDGYLWSVAKEGGWRERVRFVERGTVCY